MESREEIGTHSTEVEIMDEAEKAPKGERLGPSDVLGVSFTVEELIVRLLKIAELSPNLPIFSSHNNHRGIALHHHAFVDRTKDYVSFTHLNDTDASFRSECNEGFGAVPLMHGAPENRLRGCRIIVDSAFR